MSIFPIKVRNLICDPIPITFIIQSEIETLGKMFNIKLKNADKIMCYIYGARVEKFEN